MNRFYLGIDVAKASLDCTLMLPNGKLRSKSACPNTPQGYAEPSRWFVTQEIEHSMRTPESNRILAARDAVRDGIQAPIDWLDHEIEEMTRNLRQHIDDDPEMKDKHDPLDSIPGLGERTIALLLAFCRHSTRFDNARQATRLCQTRPVPP
jgi:transposase